MDFVLIGLDNQRIIIFGGSSNTKDLILPPGEALYELDLTSFSWYIPDASENIPNSRTGHRANLVGKYMVVSFGKL